MGSLSRLLTEHTESPVAIAEKNIQIEVSCNDEVRVAIPIQVRNCNGAGDRIGHGVELGLKGSIAIAEAYDQTRFAGIVFVGVGDSEIRITVAIEIPNCDSSGIPPSRIADRLVERS